MATKIVIEGTNITASQMSEFWRLHANPDSHVNRKTLQAYLEGRNPFEVKVTNIFGFTVTSDGRTGEDFIRDLPKNGYRVSGWAADVMRKPAFVPTKGKVYHLGLIKGEEFSDAERTTKNIRAEAARRGWLIPPVETAPLLREAVSDDEIERLGLRWLVVMHEPVVGSGGDALLVGISRDDDGQWLGASYDEQPCPQWSREGGLLFLLP